MVAASNTTGSPVAQDGYQSLTFDQTSNRITTAGFTYDPAGNQLQNNTGQAFVYDAAGRLVKVKSGTTTLATYTYDAANRRVITQTGSETSTDKTYYVWSGNSVIAEYTEQTSATMPRWSRNYIYLGGRLLATEAPNGSGEIVQYHHPDRLSTKLVTNNLDTSSFTQANLPFGTALEAEATGVGTTNRRFTSYDRSSTTGLDYAINRHYDPRQGRFTQPDPLGMAAASLADPQSLNMYSYVGNDPVNRVDPDGQFWGALFKFIVGLFKGAKPNVINGSFTYRNTPPISVAFTPNFQNISVGFAGIGFDLRTNGNWLPAILGSRETLDPQKPKYPSVTTSEINVVYGGQQFDFVQDDIVDAIVAIANRQACSDAFKKYNLTIPYDIVKSGKLRVAGSAALYQANATQLLGWSESQIAAAKATFDKENRLIRPSYTADLSYPRIPTVVFNPTQVRAQRFGNLRDVVTHAFIHLGGQPGDPNATPNDLANFNGYDEILKACR